MPRTYECPHCDRRFPARKALEDHVSRDHPEASGVSNGVKVTVGLVVLALLVAGAALLLGGSRGGSAEERFHISESPRTGSEDAPITLVAFESPACTSCRLFHTPRDGQASTIDRIKDDYVATGELLYVEKYARAGYPWEQVGANAQKCAWHLGGEEAFFALTEHFYDEQHTVSSSNVVSFAEQWAAGYPGIDDEALGACTRDRDRHEDVRRDLADAEIAGVRGTPTFLLVHHDGDVEQIPLGEYVSFASAIEQALDEAEQAGQGPGQADSDTDDGANTTNTTASSRAEASRS